MYNPSSSLIYFIEIMSKNLFQVQVSDNRYLIILIKIRSKIDLHVFGIKKGKRNIYNTETNIKPLASGSNE